MSKFLDRLKKGILICDGGMGTMLYQKGVYINRCYDELNLSSPEMISDIHKDYIKAGADIIETNTFAANRLKLKRFGLENKVKEINQAGVRIAREVSKDVIVAGAVGPIGRSLNTKNDFTIEEISEIYEEQIQVLLEEGVDVLMFETFHGIERILQAIKVARRLSTYIPIIAQLTVNDEGNSLAGESPEEIGKKLDEIDIQVIGLNCSVGPKVILDSITRIKKNTNKYLSAQPNAGIPKRIDDRIIYLTSPEYFGEYAKRFIQSGISIIGGCCGTTPEHIKAYKTTSLALSPRLIEPSYDDSIGFNQEKPIEKIKKEALKSQLARKLRNKKFVISVEIDPPRGTDVEKCLNAAIRLKNLDVDAINIADGPRASSRMSPLALAQIFEDVVGIETIPHVCCRDRNILGLQADLLGAFALGLNNVLLVTGDPPRLGDYPDATSVFDLDSIGLTKVVSRMNLGLDIAGNPMNSNTAFYVGVGANPGAIDIEKELKRLERKIKHGADFIMTQPVYELSLFKEFLKRIEEYEKPLLIGILPLSSYRNAEFLHNEVPGMQVPEKIRDTLRKASNSKEAKKIGIEIAKETLYDSKGIVAGAYIMPPFNDIEAVEVILDGWVS
ncbi:MAG: bifunctional homocysteine S-methyltransferase/methylenetetrahydrofolate reductase [Pseudomonadota bacterium]